MTRITTCAAEDGHETTAEQSALSTLRQILTGHVVGDDSTWCTGCGDTLRDGDIVLAMATRCTEQRRWTVPRLYCIGCAPATIDSPTLGVTEALVGGRLGTLTVPTTRTHSLSLTELAVRAYSPPIEGGAYCTER